MSKTDLEREVGDTTRHRGGRLRPFIRRHLKGTIAAAILAVGFIVFVLVWFQPQQALLDTTVQETLPPAGSTPSPGTGEATPSPAGQSSVLASGQFRSLEHDTT